MTSRFSPPSLLRRWQAQYLAWLPKSIQIVVASAIVISGLTITARYWDGIQALELRLFDRFTRIRGDQVVDPRILVIGITEADVRALQQPTLSDHQLAEVLTILQAANPAVIGVDLYRELPQIDLAYDLDQANPRASRARLLQQLQAPNVVSITLLGFDEATRIPPPEGIPPEQVGFNDWPVDMDGVIRRNLLFGTTPEGELFYSLSLRLSLAYLQGQGIAPQASPVNPDWMRLGVTDFIPLQPNSGSYLGLDTAGYQVLLDYRGAHLAIDQVSLTDVLSRQVEPARIRDRIVLIGNVAPSGKDLFSTPYSASEESDHLMAGVLIHAQMVSQLLDYAQGDRRPFWFWPEWGEAVWILGWALLGSAIAWRVRHALAWVMVGGAAMVVLVLTSYSLFLRQGWVPVIAPAIAMLATQGSTVAYRAQQAQRQQQMVMTLLGQNTSPEIAKALWNNRDHLLSAGRLPGQKLTATLLFSDLKNFSTIAEQMSPDELLNWLNEYLSLMTAEVQAHNGIVNKFTGDGLMAVFGVPVERTSEAEIAQDARNAVCCALQMGAHLERLDAEWRDRDLPRVRMRVGIFTGPVVAGSLGGKDRLEYGVIGDSVNIASRLESSEKDRHQGICRILITDHTLAYLGEEFAVEDWGLLNLKGRVQPVQVYQVLGAATTAHPAIAQSSPDHPPDFPGNPSGTSDPRHESKNTSTGSIN